MATLRTDATVQQMVVWVLVLENTLKMCIFFCAVLFLKK